MIDHATQALLITSGLFLVVSLGLYLVAAARRRTLDAALKRAEGLDDTAPSLGFFEAWKPSSRAALAAPELRWNYDQDYMIAFIEAARSQHFFDRPARNSTSALKYYSNLILRLDMWFAIAFAAFIVCASLLGAYWFAAWPWLARAWILVACLGALYGVADVAEDALLRRIFNHAEKIAALNGPSEDMALADAAQVDAANALTRVKFLTIFVSVIGFIAFGLFFCLDKLIYALGGPTSSDPHPNATTGEAGSLSPSLGA